MATRLRPRDVFTPNRFPVEDTNVYASRAKAEKAVRTALDLNQVPVVYGEYGVGKTTLIKRYFLPEDHSRRFIHVVSPKDKTLEDIARIVLEKLDYRVEVSRESRSGVSGDGSVETPFFSPLRAKFRGKVERGDSRREELVVSTPTDQGLLELMADEQLVLAIDEMHKATDEFRIELTEFIKAAGTLGREYPQIVLLGTTSSATAQVEPDEGVDRLIGEVRVEPMTDAEAASLVNGGMARLEIAIDPTLVDRLLRTAAGAPALPQEMCFDIATAVFDRQDTVVAEADVDAAIKGFLLRSGARLTRRYMSAIETVGERRYRKQILRATAESPGEFVTMEELVKRVSTQLGTAVPATALSGPLKALKSESAARS